MTLQEAEKILSVVAAALQDRRHRHYALSSLKGFDIYHICTALKLRIANEFLLLNGRDDFEEQFEKGLKLYDGIPWSIMRFVPDDQADSIDPEWVFNPTDPVTLEFKDERLASEETAASFGAFCKLVGSHDPSYWRKVYARLGLEYTPESPRENIPLTGD